MKKISSRSVILAFLLLTSITSYVFLTSYAPTSAAYGSEEYSEETTTVEQDYLLPDVMLVKEIIDLGKRLTSIGR